MSRARSTDSFSDAVSPPAAPVGIYTFASSLASLASGSMLLLSAPFSLADDAAIAAVLAGAGGIGVLGSVRTLRRPLAEPTLRPVPTLSAAVLAFVVVAAVSTLVYLATGSLDRVDDALYESVAGVSTSALTVFGDPSVLSDGVLIWRSATQWLGGLGALCLAVGLLPFLGGSRELADLRSRRSEVGSFAPRPTPALRRVGVIYCAVTALVVVAFVITGMGFRDAVAHAFSSVSTGGFSTHAASIAHFDSLAIELVTIVVMAGAGSSVALTWMVWRGQFADTRRAFEVRVYIAVIVTATLWVWWLQHDRSTSGARSLRESLFTVVSLVTTTGHRVGDWGTWHPGATTLLLVLLAIGGMAGSVAGGLRWIRVIGLLQFLWRELQRQLHPRSVRSVKVGDALISEDSVDRMHAQLIYIMSIGAVVAVGLGFFGSGIDGAVSLSLSALSTTGPGFEVGETITNASILSRPQRALLMPTMLMGRLFMYPAFIAFGTLVLGIRTAARAQTRMRRVRSTR